MKHIILKYLLFLILILYSCDSSTEVNVLPPLENIYRLNNSQVKFEIYLNLWHSKIDPIDQNEFNLLFDTLKSVYNIYRIFYDPFDLGKYCTTGSCPEFGNNIYEGLKYIIVQNEIKYSLNEYEDHRSIKTFRPQIDTDGIILYLSNDYKEELDAFLDVDKYQDEIRDRHIFLNTKLKIWPGHWFGWHFLTHPEVSIIYINKDLDSATVHFRIIFQGGEAKFKRTLDKWEMIESKLTWIE